MKKSIILLICFLAILSCKNETKSKAVNQNDELTLLEGEFVFYDGAAVLQTPTEIYGVFITDKIQELNKQAKQYQKAPTDMVKVEIKGKVSTQKDDKILWDNKVEIVEILNISASNQVDNNVVKLGEQ
ncbi:hypothetical protein [Thalassobellus suaedae]|uniref:NlpE C-terminal OB domain-containing protein n=1 Tax=Thalassobellus suaedae TaxID=3074124 RepID=A0ABY9XR83_9FLAO|nr:hypothetical protein RHP51_15020 [Flavobacteriaceae bacterium HL-DH14]